MARFEQIVSSEMLKHLAVKMVAAFALLRVFSANAQELGSNPDDLAKQAVAANPALQAIEYGIAALEHKAEASSVWKDPVVSVEYSNVPWDSWSLSDSPMSGVQLRLQQSLTWPGKNRRRVETVEMELAVRKLGLAEKQNQLRALVKRTYWQLAQTRQLKQITERHIEWVDQLTEVVRYKYETGKVGQHDLLRLTVQKETLMDAIHDFDERDTIWVAALNEAMGRPPNVPIITPDTIPLAKTTQHSDDFVRAALAHRPSLKEAKERVTWQETAANQAAHERWPDINVWAGYRFRRETGMDPGTDFVSVGVAIPIPFDFTGRSRAKKDQRLAMADSAHASADAILLGIRASLVSAKASWDRAVEKANTYQKTLIPEAEKTFRSTLDAYRADRADFTSLFDVEMQLIQFEKELITAKTVSQVERIRIEMLTGKSV